MKLQQAKFEISNPQLILELVQNFLLKFNPQQLELAGQQFYYLASCYTDYLLQGHAEAITGIRYILTALRKVQGESSKLSSPYDFPICGSLHREFTKLCIKSKCYQHALQVIEHPTTSFKKNTSPMDIVSYLYYKGMIYTGLKRYQDAIEQFKLVLSFPTTVTHKVHCESYKKLILLTLLKVGEGKVPLASVHSNMKQIFPKEINPMLKQKLEIGFTVYQQLIDTFVNRDQPLVFEELLLTKQADF